MKRFFITTFILSLSISNLAYANTEHNKLLDISRNSSKELLGTLKTQLTSALKDKNTEQAVIVCSSVAQDIANNVSKKNNISIKRVSLKNRNPNGLPDDYEMKNLKLFEELKSSNKLAPNHEVYSIVTENNEKYFRYMKPIVTVKSCLQCHGTKNEVKENVRNILIKKYPKDIAFDYKEGDIRGAVSSKIKL